MTGEELRRVLDDAGCNCVPEVTEIDHGELCAVCQRTGVPHTVVKHVDECGIFSRQRRLAVARFN